MEGPWARRQKLKVQLGFGLGPGGVGSVPSTNRPAPILPADSAASAP